MAGGTGSKSENKVALVSGASGIQGRPLLELLSQTPGWTQIYGVSRRAVPDLKNVVHLPLDLSNEKAIEAKFREAGVSGVTHFFHCAFAGDMSNRDKTSHGWLKSLIAALEKTGNPLQHVYVTQGTKYYGMHLGLVKTPFHEDDPRHMPENFYFDDQDFLDRSSNLGNWTWSILRPGPIMGYNLGSYMNLMQVVAVYAVFCKELGLALRFPGSLTGYNALVDCVDSRLLAEAELFLADTPSAHGQAYNISNGDTFRWHQVWPAIAKWFGLEVGPPVPVPLAVYMSDKADAWQRIQDKHGLEKVPFDQVASWDFGDACFNLPGDVFANVNQLRQAGFNGQKVDSQQMMLDKLDELARLKIIPNYPQQS